MKMYFDQLDTISGQLNSNAFYILDIEKVKRNYKDFLDAFKVHYSNTSIGYSYKTNYIPEICKTVDQLGAYAEVVSKLEYDISQLIKVNNRVIFNGPVKYEDDIYTVLNDGNIINIDSMFEVETLEKISNYSNKEFNVGVRCYFNIESYIKSRFGVDAEASAIDDVVAKINSLKGFKVNGLHCHFSTKKRDLNSFKVRTEKLLKTSKRIFTSENPKYIDIGGGFFSRPSDEVLKRFPDLNIPSFEEYGRVVGQLMKEYYPDENVELILEPGTALVADTLSFYTRVLNIKKLEGRKVALVDGSQHNVKPTGGMNSMSFTHYTKSPERSEDQEIDIVGYTCMETDILYNDYQGSLREGDFLRYDNVGAYTVVFKPPFIQGQFPIIVIEGNDNFRVVKNRETANSFLQDYIY